jgi:hypothetical protein
MIIPAGPKAEDGALPEFGQQNAVAGFFAPDTQLRGSSSDVAFDRARRHS